MEKENLLLYIIKKLQKVRGKKAFQKLVYLIDAYGVETGYEFQLHQYGPFSYQLAGDLDNLIAEKTLVYEAPGMGYGQAAIYLSEEAQKDSSISSVELPEDVKSVADKICDTFGNDDPNTLELLATVHLISTAIFGGKKGRTENLSDVVTNLKPGKFSRSEIDEAIEHLNEPGLLQIER